MRESSENRRKREEEAEEARSAEERKKKILQVSKSDLSGRDLLRALVRNVLISQDWISVLLESSFCLPLRKNQEAWEQAARPKQRCLCYLVVRCSRTPLESDTSYSDQLVSVVNGFGAKVSFNLKLLHLTSTQPNCQLDR